AAGAISGTLFKADAPGQVLGDVDMDLLDHLGKFVPNINARSDAATGVYTLGSIPPGQYFVRANPQPVSQNAIYVTTWFPASQTQLGASLVTVDAGATTTTNITLPRGGIISGRVLNATTTAVIPGARITVFKSATPDIVIGLGGTTDAGGNYTTLA